LSGYHARNQPHDLFIFLTTSSFTSAHGQFFLSLTLTGITMYLKDMTMETIVVNKEGKNRENEVLLSMMDELSFGSHSDDKKKRRRRRRRRRRRYRHRKSHDQCFYPHECDYIALDCEMVGLGPDGRRSSIARVTVIDWFGNVQLDEYIRQTEQVTDYRTHISGITEEDLKNATMTQEECREIMYLLLQNRILVGHDLRNDLTALGITHPWWMTRDTAKYESFMRRNLCSGTMRPRKLKELASEILHQDIQVSGRPHSSYEDALAALDLYRSVRIEWENTIATEHFAQEINSFLMQEY
jgi:RNA exonuclease 4